MNNATRGYTLDYAHSIKHVALEGIYVLILSYDIAAFQWITSCNKSVMATRVLTLLHRIRNVIDDVRNNCVNFHWKYVHFKGDKIIFI